MPSAHLPDITLVRHTIVIQCWCYIIILMNTSSQYQVHRKDRRSYSITECTTYRRLNPMSTRMKTLSCAVKWMKLQCIIAHACVQRYQPSPSNTDVSDSDLDAQEDTGTSTCEFHYWKEWSLRLTPSHGKKTYLPLYLVPTSWLTHLKFRKLWAILLLGLYGGWDHYSC